MSASSDPLAARSGPASPRCAGGGFVSLSWLGVAPFFLFALLFLLLPTARLLLGASRTPTAISR